MATIRLPHISLACFFHGVAAMFVLAFPLGICIFTFNVVYDECLGTANRDGFLARFVTWLATYLIVYGYLSLPIGVCLHWIIAKKTESHPRWVWLAMVVSSAMLMVWYFPNGTISGGITLCLLFALSTFKRMKNGIRIF